MEHTELDRIWAGKQRRRSELARLPIEEKIRAVVRLQQMAAPILRQRGKNIQPWNLEPPS